MKTSQTLSYFVQASQAFSSIISTSSREYKIISVQRVEGKLQICCQFSLYPVCWCIVLRFPWWCLNSRRKCFGGFNYVFFADTFFILQVKINFIWLKNIFDKFALNCLAKNYSLWWWDKYSVLNSLLFCHWRKFSLKLILKQLKRLHVI